MHFSRFRVGVIAAAGAAALLSLPVGAAGQVPSVGGVVGGVTDQLPSLPAPVPAVPAPAVPAPLPAPSVQAPAPPPAPSLPAAPSAPAPSLPQAPVPQLPKPGGTTPAPVGSSPGQSAPSARVSAPSSTATAAERSRRATKDRSSGSGRQRDGGGKANRSSAESAAAPKGIATANTDATLASVAIQGGAADLPDNASPDTAPFTGLQLAYLVAIGLMLATAGLSVRTMARR